MWLDLIGLAFLAAFMLTGLLRGTLASFLRIISLVISYAVALWTAPQLGPIVAERMSLPTFLAMPIAGALAFAGSYTVLSVLSKLAQMWEKHRRDGEERTPADRIGGAILGGVQGAFLMLLLGWLGLFIEAGHSTGSLESLPDPGSSALKKISQTVIEVGAAAVIDEKDPSARMTAKMLARPTETYQSAERVLSNPRIQALQNDPLFWSYVESGAYDTALNQGSFLGIAYDDTLRKELAQVGLIGKHAATDPRLFRNEVREVLTEVGPRIRDLRSDPALQALLRNPEVMAAIEAGDYLALLQNPEFRAVLSRVLEGDPSQN